MEIKYSLLVLFVIFLLRIKLTEGLLQRCYSCRSRGELGSCKDPFLSGEEDTAIESVPCASGWCGKMLETEDALKEVPTAVSLNNNNNLEEQIKQQWRMERVQTIPIVFSTTGVVPKCLLGNIKKLDLSQNLYNTMQKTVLLATTSEYGIATQRRCLQRGPSDNEERCAYTKVQHRKVFMCFCRGDLCNSSNKVIISAIIYLPMILIIRLIL